jgi:hypothetical protein
MLLRIETAATRDALQHFSDIAQLRKTAIATTSSARHSTAQHRASARR